ncbi:MAG: peptidoglycan DD-metalloendopeptidase family protein [Rubrivivax sp.]|nr:peptidoglycan DD-metalloendopeptidase family protein [Rubrivivax sp.]
MNRQTRLLLHRPLAAAGLLGALLMLAACSSTPNRAPIEERQPRPPVVAAAPLAAASAATTALPDSGRTLPGAENAGKPGFYTVKPGDTLIRIALENGQNWRDVQRWNGMDNPNLVEVGQVLRVAPPVTEGAAVTRPVAAAGRVDAKPLDARAPGAPLASVTAGSAAVTSPVPGPAGSAVAVPAPVAASVPPPAKPASPREGDDDVNWAWPAAGTVLAGFDEVRSKGLAISGKAGDPVLAAADGRVVYAGSGLRGYGNLVIIKHNATYLTAYAHNQSLLVKDEQVVRRGQKIAEMGSSDADRVQLHFEIRRLGVPIDPMRLLPPR